MLCGGNFSSDVFLTKGTKQISIISKIVSNFCRGSDIPKVVTKQLGKLSPVSFDSVDVYVVIVHPKDSAGFV